MLKSNDAWDQYRGLGAVLGEYWEAYGGWRSLFFSPYMHASVFVTAITFHRWTADSWWDTPLQVLPNLLGFTLGGYALLATMGGRTFQRLLAGEPNQVGPTPGAQLTSAFVHYLVLQILALVTAICAQSEPFHSIFNYNMERSSLVWASFRFPAQLLAILFSGFVWFLFVYAVLSSLAAVMAVFRATKILWLAAHNDIM